tara:strand:- start:953 stop:2230 length:1278 start_codon:yes stop_codon:yes gene_type:complete
MTNPDKLIHIIGINASGVEGLSSSMQELIVEAERIIAPSRTIESIENWWSKSINFPIPQILSSDNLSGIILELQSKNKKTVILASGDPLWFGIGRLLLEVFPREKLYFHPSPTSLQLAFSRLGRPWQDASWISLHGRDSLALGNLLQKQPSSIAVLTDPTRGPQEVKQFLKASGLENLYKFWIFEQLGHANERIQELKAHEEVPNDLHPLNLVVLIKREPQIPSNIPLFGIDDCLFLQYSDRPGLMTKKEIRVQLLSDLELPSEGVLWDICAGVGSIGLEALRIRSNLKLFALDKRVGCKELIKTNAKRLSVEPFAISESDALSTLINKKIPPELIPPDRVLLGGGGVNRAPILKKIIELLKPNGIVVIPLSTLQAVNEIEEVLSSTACNFKVSQHQAYRGIKLGEGTRLAPINPVFILKGKKEA